jgi:hypothetical protein
MCFGSNFYYWHFSRPTSSSSSFQTKRFLSTLKLFSKTHSSLYFKATLFFGNNFISRSRQTKNISAINYICSIQKVFRKAWKKDVLDYIWDWFQNELELSQYWLCIRKFNNLTEVQFSRNVTFFFFIFLSHLFCEAGVHFQN